MYLTVVLYTTQSNSFRRDPVRLELFFDSMRWWLTVKKFAAWKRYSTVKKQISSDKPAQYNIAAIYIPSSVDDTKCSLDDMIPHIRFTISSRIFIVILFFTSFFFFFCSSTSFEKPIFSDSEK